jgi:TetR/AcrR family transcriptional regulator
MAGSARSAPRTVGRPRADRRRRTRPPEEEILHVSADLFARRGFAGTSTRAIAEAAGLRQPSLFHWFPSKEAILERLLERTLAPSLEFAEALAGDPAPAAERLERLLRFDVQKLCEYPFDPAIVFSPEAHQPRFRRFWGDRARFLRHVHALIAQGVAEGDLAAADTELAARAILGMGESTLFWARRSDTPPETTAARVAALALRSLRAS